MGIAAICFHAIGARNILKSFNQCWNWCELWLPAGTKFHTLGIAAICWAIWKTCNAICFEGKPITNLLRLFATHVCSWVTRQVFFLESDKESLLEGVNTMLAIAMKLVAKKKKQGHLLLKDGQDEAQD